MLETFLKFKKLLAHRGSGQFGSLLHGAGVDLAENRQYSPGDEKRSINRKMSAKYDKLFINVFHDEKALDVHLCCDINYNRRAKSRTQNAELNKEKSGSSDLFVVFFAELTAYFHGKKAHITGRIGDKQFVSLEQIGYQKNFLEACEKTLQKTFPTYTSSLHTLLTNQRAISKRRLIIIISDFLDYSDEHKRRVNMLRQKHEVVLFRVPTDVKIPSSDIVSLEVFGG